MSLRTYLRRWWPTRRPQEKTSPPYEVACFCGHSLRGQRQRSSHVVTCPNCGRKRFLLPSSPWPGGDTSAVLSSPPAKQAVASPGNLGRLVLVIVVGGAAAMGLIYLLAKPYLRRPGSPPETTPAADIRTHIEAGKHALREEAFRLALKELNTALELCDHNPDVAQPGGASSVESATPAERPAGPSTRPIPGRNSSPSHAASQ